MTEKEKAREIALDLVASYDQHMALVVAIAYFNARVVKEVERLVKMRKERVH